jgi:hypothetical protein
MPRYPQGQPVTVSTTVKTATGALADPTDISLTVQKPDGTNLPVYDYNPGPIVRDSLGLFHNDIPTTDLTANGHYAYKFVATGANAGVSYSVFEVFDPLEISVLSLQDAKDHLNIAQATVTYDSEIQSKIATIQASLEKMTGGPIITRTVTERVRVGSNYRTLTVRQRPLVGVTSITDIGTGVALVVTDLDLDTNAGIIRRKLGFSFLGLGSYFTVVYTAGWGTAVPPAFNEAARIILEHLWQTQHGPSVRPSFGGEDEVTLPGFGFAIPNRAAELLSPFAIEAYV